MKTEMMMWRKKMLKGGMRGLCGCGDDEKMRRWGWRGEGEERTTLKGGMRGVHCGDLMRPPEENIPSDSDPSKGRRLCQEVIWRYQVPKRYQIGTKNGTKTGPKRDQIGSKTGPNRGSNWDDRKAWESSTPSHSEDWQTKGTAALKMNYDNFDFWKHEKAVLRIWLFSSKSTQFLTWMVSDILDKMGKWIARKVTLGARILGENTVSQPQWKRPVEKIETYEHLVDRDIVDIIAKKIAPPKRMGWRKNWKKEEKRKWYSAGLGWMGSRLIRVEEKLWCMDLMLAATAGQLATKSNSMKTARKK